MEDVVMSTTIFLSYTHSDSEIAEKLDNSLRTLGYDVKRDIRNVDKWDDLQCFMKSIRKQDYAVFQFMKDENFGDRSFPIAIGFSETEKNMRKIQNKPTSLFDDFYWIEIIRYWQDYALDMKTQLEQVNRENAGELDFRYRIVNGLAQTAAEFLGSSFARKLLATIDSENMNIEETVIRIDKIISSDTSDDRGR